MWNGLKIDKNLRIRQKREQLVSILDMPYQHLKSQTHAIAIRSRTSAEFSRYASTRLVGLREIDKEATKINKK